MDKKYKLSDRDNNGLYHIIALRDIPRYNVRTGDKGGRVSGEHNLRQKGDCWIRHDAHVCDNARVCDNACVWDHVLICDYATVCNNAQVDSCAVVRGHAVVSDDAQVGDHAQVCGGHIAACTVIGNDMWISGGFWEITPEVIHGSEHDIIYDITQVSIGHECHPIEWWQVHGRDVMEGEEFYPEQVEEYQKHLDVIAKHFG